MNSIPVLTIEDVATLDGVLGDFLKKAEAELTVVIDRGGNVISQFGDMSVMDVTVIAALAAGSFAATKELARRIGEIEFNALYHQGNGSHMFMNSVDDDTIMITVIAKACPERSRTNRSHLWRARSTGCVDRLVLKCRRTV